MRDLKLDQIEQALVNMVPHRTLFMTVTGSDLYGFASEDSDVDIRGAFVISTKKCLKIEPPASRFAKTTGGTPPVDLVMWDVRQVAALLLKGNPNTIEQVLSPIVVYHELGHGRFVHLAHRCVTRKTVAGFRGLASQTWYRAKKEGSAKALLYAFRAQLQALHILAYGWVHMGGILTLRAKMRAKMSAHMPDIPSLTELVERKIAGGEAAKLSDEEADPYLAAIGQLDDEADRAVAESTLIMEPTDETYAEVEDHMISMRKERA